MGEENRSSKNSLSVVGSIGLFMSFTSLQFESVSEFLLMGGHGVFVWSAYGLTLLVLSFLVLKPMLNNRRFFSEQQMLIRRQQASVNESVV